MERKVTTFVKDEARRVASLAWDGIRSRAYLYPLKGIMYALSHRRIWQPLVSQAWKSLALGMAVTTGLFALTYVPQTLVLSFTSGAAAPVSAALLVLAESAALTKALSRFLFARGLVSPFDDTFVALGGLAGGGGGGAAAAAATTPPATLGLADSLLRSLVYLPLNFVPVVGSAMYVVAQGSRAGPAAHERYFQLKGWSRRQRDVWVRDRRAAYTSFGTAAAVLEMVPFASAVFAYTNAVGAAVWAADIERAAS